MPTAWTGHVVVVRGVMPCCDLQPGDSVSMEKGSGGATVPVCNSSTYHDDGPDGTVRDVGLFVVEGKRCLRHSRSHSLGHSCSNCWLLSFTCLASLSIMYMSSVLFLLLFYLLLKLHKFCLYELISYF